MTIVNSDNPDESVFFIAPFKPIEPIVSNAGKQVTNEMQALGSSITYMRRYLYMIALDICEPDGIDVGTGAAPQPIQPVAPVVAPTPAPAPAPIVTPPAQKPLTNADGNASDIQITQLKSVLKQLREKDPTKEELIAEIALKTQGFTVISKADCETLTLKIGKLLNEGDK
jgi:hypothetical protein